MKLNEEISKIKSMMGILVESELTTFVRRRISDYDLKDKIDNVMSNTDISDFFNSSAYVARVCDNATYKILRGSNYTREDFRSLYFYLLDKFGGDLLSYFRSNK